MIEAERVVAAPPQRVFEFLAHLPNHWRLEDSLREVESTGDRSARVRMRGPFGIVRVAETEVLEAVAPSLLRGRAVVGGTVASVGWDLEPDGAGTRVRLHTTIERASPRDRLVLALGGRRWLCRVYARVLENLEEALS